MHSYHSIAVRGQSATSDASLQTVHHIMRSNGRTTNAAQCVGAYRYCDVTNRGGGSHHKEDRLLVTPNSGCQHTAAPAAA